MIKYFSIVALFLTTCLAHAGSFTINVTTKGFSEDVVSLNRYDDLFTMRTFMVSRSLLNSERRATLEGEVNSITRMQLRIGERTADLYVGPGMVLNVVASPLPGALSLNGTSRMGVDFTDIDPLNPNALVSDLNTRIDAFIGEDLATDQAAGMQALDIKRQVGGAVEDSTKRPPTLFVTPVLSAAKVDTFTTKLRRFYADVKDPWFSHYLEYSIAGMHFGPRTKDSDLHANYLKGKAVLYDDPEYIRFIRNMFADHLEQVDRSRPDRLAITASTGKKDSLRTLFQRNDFLRNDDRLAELVMVDQLYRKHAMRLVPRPNAEAILADVGANSAFPEHKIIATNMLWDLTAMRVGSDFPTTRLEDPSGRSVVLADILDGPVCIALTAGWCTYCATEIDGLVKLGAQYPVAVKVVVIGLDKSLEEFNAMRKKVGENKFTWLHAAAEQELREQLRVRSLPTFYLLNGNVLARSPAPLPSEGLGALFHQAKVQAEKKEKIKVWDD